MLLAIVFGLLLPLTIRFNEVLGRYIGAVPSSVSVHVTGGIFGALLLLPFVQPGWTAGVTKAPWWAWLGGVVGAGLVVLANRSVGAVGIATFMAISLSVQLAAGATLDHFGLFQSAVVPITPGRAVGIVLLAVGAVLVTRG